MVSKCKEMRHATLETGGDIDEKRVGVGQAGKHKFSSVGQGHTMSPGSHGRAVI